MNPGFSRHKKSAESLKVLLILVILVLANLHLNHMLAEISDFS